MDNLLDNDTGDTIKRITNDGIALGEEIEIDFFVVAPDEKSAALIADRISKMGFSVSIEYDEDDDDWTCYCTTI